MAPTIPVGEKRAVKCSGNGCNFWKGRVMYCSMLPPELPGLAKLSAITSGSTTAMPMNPFPDIQVSYESG